jgi:hypothetical protein
MAEIEHPERYSWWLNELESLGVNTLEKNGLNNHKEASDLTEAVKQTLYEEYLHQAYSRKYPCFCCCLETVCFSCGSSFTTLT